MKQQQLHSVAKIIAGQSPPSSTYNSSGDGLPFFQGKADFQDKYPRVRTWCNSTNAKEAKPGDILMSVRAPVGSVNICDQKSIIGRGLSAIRVNSTLDSNFLYYFLKSNEQAIAKLGTGSTFKAITQDTLKKVEIPLPPLDDQIRIAHLLSKVEGLITQRKQHLQQLDDLLKSVFLEMFGPTNPAYADWPLVQIKELAAQKKGSMRTGPFGSNLLHSEFTPNGDIAVLGIDNAVQNRFAWGEPRYITEDKYKELEIYRIFPGDVIVTIMGTIGRSAVIPDEIPVAINTKHLAAMTLDRKIANPIFLSYSIHSNPFIINQFKSKNRGAIMSGLNLTIIKETKIKRPPIEKQNEFAAINERIDSIKCRYQQNLTDLENVYGALSQKAFKGELDLSRLPISENDVEKNEQPEHAIDEKTTSALFELPEPMDRALLHSDKNRKQLLDFWLAAWCDHKGNEPFTAMSFIESAYQRLTELLESKAFQLDGISNGFDEGEFYQDPPQWGVAEFDLIKTWVFNELESGRLEQSLNIANNQVLIARSRNHTK